VVRSYNFHDEVHYVVRQADGTPLAVPGWMTRPEAAHAKIGSSARLPLRELLELQRVNVAYLAAREHNVHEEAHDVTAPSKTPTTTLRRIAMVPAVRLPREVQAQLRQALVHWMQALAKAVREEDGHEQDHR
jgi:hypothetical protein